MEFSPAVRWSIDKDGVLQADFVLGIGGISEQEISLQRITAYRRRCSELARGEASPEQSPHGLLQLPLWTPF